MRISDVFSMGGRGGCGGCDCDGGRRFNRFDGFRDHGFRRSSFFDGGFRNRRFRDRDHGSLIDIDIL